MKDGTSLIMEWMFINFQIQFKMFKKYIVTQLMDNIATVILECIAIWAQDKDASTAARKKLANLCKYMIEIKLNRWFIVQLMISKHAFKTMDNFVIIPINTGAK